MTHEADIRLRAAKKLNGSASEARYDMEASFLTMSGAPVRFRQTPVGDDQRPAVAAGDVADAQRHFGPFAAAAGDGDVVLFKQVGLDLAGVDAGGKGVTQDSELLPDSDPGCLHETARACSPPPRAQPHPEQARHQDPQAETDCEGRR